MMGLCKDVRSRYFLGYVNQTSLPTFFGYHFDITPFIDTMDVLARFRCSSVSMGEANMICIAFLSCSLAIVLSSPMVMSLHVIAYFNTMLWTQPLQFCNDQHNYVHGILVI